MPRLPRVLVTGFSIFPGASVNPTEMLVGRIGGAWDRFGDICDLRTAVFDVDYRSLPPRLEAIGAAFAPDIAIHFGLSASATGFRLERLARNEIRPGSPDNAGHQPRRRTIMPGGANLPSTLPLAAIEAALARKGLPVDSSDDAGGYLCNFLFYNVAGNLCPGFAPVMAGFIHVPPFPGPATPHGLTIEQLVDGARTIIGVCVDAWQTASPKRKKPGIAAGLLKAKTAKPTRLR